MKNLTKKNITNLIRVSKMWTEKSRGTTRNITYERKKSWKCEGAEFKTGNNFVQYLPHKPKQQCSRGNMGFWTLYHGSATIAHKNLLIWPLLRPQWSQLEYYISLAPLRTAITPPLTPIVVNTEFTSCWQQPSKNLPTLCTCVFTLFWLLKFTILTCSWYSLYTSVF